MPTSTKRRRKKITTDEVSESRAKGLQYDEVKYDFQQKLHLAKLQNSVEAHSAYVEAPLCVFKNFLGEHSEETFFILEGVKIYLEGHYETIENEQNMPMNKKLHGAAEATIEGRE